MNKNPKELYTVGYADIKKLRKAAEKYGASESELACIERLSRFEASASDIETIRPLAEKAGIDTGIWTWDKCL